MQRLTACSTIDLPLPSTRLATAALNTLQVDKELSPLVKRSFAVVKSGETAEGNVSHDGTALSATNVVVLRTQYKATTNRMLRVAVNGFMESLSVVIGVMAELDVDVIGITGPDA